MRMNLKIALLAAMLLASPAQGQVDKGPASTRVSTAQDALKALDAGDVSVPSVLFHIGDGLLWANAYVIARGDSAIYCPPLDLSVTREQSANIFRNFLSTRPKMLGMPVGFAMVAALKQVFPCAQKNR